MPRAGRLRHRVTLQSPAGTQDTAGGLSGWTDVATVSAGIEPLRGRERAAHEKYVDEVDTLIVIRWYPDVLATWRIKHASTCCGIAVDQYFGIQAGITPREIHHKDLELPCRRVDTGEPIK